MGGGASRSRKSRAKAAGSPGQALLLDATGPDGGGRPASADDPPALRRRRRLLFGAGQAIYGGQFEALAPRQQFTAELPGAAAVGDTVFDRVSDLEVIKALRRRAEETQYGDKDGYLAENAIELLELGFETGTPLSKRLFQVAQVQRVPGGRQRKPLMTCYELLAVSSVLRAGQDSDLLEFLFCIFDVDADDRLSVEDLTVGIDAFLGLRDAAESFDKKEDRDDFARMDRHMRHKEARRLAELAIKDYGAMPSPPKENHASGESSAEDDDDEDVVEAVAPKPGAAAAADVRGAGWRKGKKQDLVGEDSDSDDSGRSPSSKKAGASPPSKPKRRGRSLCGGKKPIEGDSGSESPGAPGGSEAQEATKKKPRSKRSGLCRGSPPDSDGSDSEGAFLGSKSKAALKEKAKAKPKPKPRPKQRSGGGFCGSVRRRKQRVSLSYEAWVRWLSASQFLPADFAGLAADLQETTSSDKDDMAAAASRKVPVVAGAGSLISGPPPPPPAPWSSETFGTRSEALAPALPVSSAKLDGDSDDEITQYVP